MNQASDRTAGRTADVTERESFQSACPSNTRAKVRRFSGGKPLALTHTCRKIHTALIFLISQTTLQPQVPQCHARGLEGQGENEVMKCMLKREKSMNCEKYRPTTIVSEL